MFPLPAVQGALVVVEVLGFHRKYTGRRSQPLGCQGTTGHQATAAATHQHGVQGTGILQQLQAHSALAGHDVRVVIGGHQHAAVPGHKGTGNGLPVLAMAVVENHFGPQGAGIVSLDPGRVGRHHDARPCTQEPGRQGNTLGMVTR